VFDRPGEYRVTLIVWDSAGRGGRAEKMISVLPGKTPSIPAPEPRWQDTR